MSPGSTQALPALPPARWRRWLARWRQDGFGVLAPLAAVVLFLGAIVVSIGYLHTEEIRREQEALKRDVEYGHQRLRLRLLERQEQLMRLARDVANRDVTPAQFNLRAQALINQQPELMSVSWIDPQRQVLASHVSPVMADTNDWTVPDTVHISQEVVESFDLARDLSQPVYLQPLARKGAEPVLLLQVPLAVRGRFTGTVLAEYSVDGLLRYGVPSELLARYAMALLDGQGALLTGQLLPERARSASHLPWSRPQQEVDLPVTPVGNGLVLRAQAWPAAQGMVGNALFWLVALLSAMTAWMLIANWRHARRRLQAQQALEEETMFRRAMENSMLTGMRALDLRGRIIYVNPAFCQMTGWGEDELIGQSQPFSYWPEEDREELALRLVDELGGAADPAGFQMRVKRKDATLFDARLYVSPLIDATGKQTGWMASMTDITEPNRVRHQLSASYERFTTVLEALDASVSVAPLGSQELLFANKLYRQWFGATTEGHLSLVMRAGTPDTSTSDESLDTVDSFAGLPLDGLTSSRSEHAEIRIERLDKWLEVRSRYLNWVDGRLAQMVIATDITARRHAEEQAAAQAERAHAASRLITMGEMASSVAHELNQPLTAISNYCTGMISRLQSGTIQTDDLLGALEKTARQAQRAGQVVHHIRSFVKRSEPRLSHEDVHTIIEQVVELAEIEMRRRQVRLIQNVPPLLPRLLVDPILIEQVLLNLIKNGAESIDMAQRAPVNRVIELRVQSDAEDGEPVVRFSVTDSGHGLAPEALQRLYEAFFSTKQEGLGIGLNLCRSIVESHRGRIGAQNLYNGPEIVGCRFAFWIPVAVPAQTARLTDPSKAPA